MDQFRLKIEKSDFYKCNNFMDLIDGKLVISNKVFMDINLELLKIPSVIKSVLKRLYKLYIIIIFYIY